MAVARTKMRKEENLWREQPQLDGSTAGEKTIITVVASTKKHEGRAVNSHIRLRGRGDLMIDNDDRQPEP